MIQLENTVELIFFTKLNPLQKFTEGMRCFSSHALLSILFISFLQAWCFVHLATVYFIFHSFYFQRYGEWLKIQLNPSPIFSIEHLYMTDSTPQKFILFLNNLLSRTLQFIWPLLSTVEIISILARILSFPTNTPLTWRRQASAN